VGGWGRHSLDKALYPLVYYLFVDGNKVAENTDYRELRPKASIRGGKQVNKPVLE